MNIFMASSTVVIEQNVLGGSPDDDSVQRIATVYADGERYSVVAPAKLKGESIRFTEHFSVREPSKDALDWGAEFLVTGQRRDLILNAVAEELRKQKRDAGRAVGRTPDGIYFRRSNLPAVGTYKVTQAPPVHAGRSLQ